MKILISPYSRKLRGRDTPNPKNYPHWNELVRLLKEDGHYVIQIGVSGEAKIEGVDEHLVGKSLKALWQLLVECDTFVSVDNFFPHLAHLTEKPGFVLWGPSDPLIFGHKENTNILKHRKYLRKKMFDIWEELNCDDERFVTPDKVMEVIRQSFVSAAA